MHIDKMGKQLANICVLWNELHGNLSLKTASKEEQLEMQDRIRAVVSIYNHAKDNKIEYVPNIRKELNSIYYTLKRWDDYNDIVIFNALAGLAQRLKK